jgi:foldase protein PrsA
VRLIFIAVAGILLALVALAGCSAEGDLSVNGSGIPRTELEIEVQRRVASVRRQTPEELEGKKGKAFRAEVRRQAATDLVRAELMREQARKLSVKVPPGEIDDMLNEAKRSVGVDRFEKDLREQGLTEDRYREILEERALVEALGRKLSEGVSVTTDEAESFYLTSKELFGQPRMVHAAHILLDSAGQAEVVAAEAKRGADFSTLAKSFSKDAETRSAGGDLGWFERGTREPAVEDKAFSLRPGEVSGVVTATDGYHIVKVIDHREASTPPFTEVKVQAVEMLTNRKREEVFSDWLRTVYANARVNAGDAGKWDPALGMVVER